MLSKFAIDRISHSSEWLLVIENINYFLQHLQRGVKPVSATCRAGMITAMLLVLADENHYDGVGICGNVAFIEMPFKCYSFYLI